MKTPIKAVTLKKPLYHIALDCIDRHAADPAIRRKAALIFVSGDIRAGERESVTRLSYAALKKITDKAARVFAALELPPRSPFLVRLGNAPEFAAAFFGLMKAGLLPLPLSELLTAAEIVKAAEVSGVTGIVSVADAAFGKTLAGRKKLFRAAFFMDRKLSRFNGVADFRAALAVEPARFFTPPVAADAPAFLLFTSGTRGEGKIVAHAHRSLPAHDARVRKWLALEAGEVAFNTGSLGWSYALNCGFLDVLRRGGTALFYGGPPDPENLLHLVNRHGVAVFMSVPALYKRLTDYLRGHRVVLPSLRTCVSAADFLPESVCAEFKSLTGLSIRQGFGMTEHSVYLFQDAKSPSSGDGVGKPFAAKLVKILRPDGREAPRGETGVIACHKSCPGLMLGYGSGRGAWNLPLRDGWFHTGDLAFRDARGEFHFVGRDDELINRSGYRVAPREVERAILEMEGVAEAAVFAVPGEAGGTKIAAAVVPVAGRRADARFKRNLLAHCRARLAPFKIPAVVVFREKLPKTRSGKVRRGVLAASVRRAFSRRKR